MMKKKNEPATPTKDESIEPSEFKGLKGIEYFDFEEDFIDENIRCIPMIVRFKMDSAGIKLSLSEWSKFNVEERIGLALLPCNNVEEAKWYNDHLSKLIDKYTGNQATVLKIEQHPAWAGTDAIPVHLLEKAKELACHIRIDQWKSLTPLQRFALLKLYRPGHENKNFQKALKEFGLIA